MASLHFHYAVKEYGPYVASVTQRNSNIKPLAEPRIPMPWWERQAELDQQFNPVGIPKIALEEKE